MPGATSDWLVDHLGERQLRVGFRQDVEDALLNTLTTAIQDQMKRRESLVADEVLARANQIASTKTSFVVDLPIRGWEAEGHYPRFWSDYKRRYFRSSATPEEDKLLWAELVPQLMRKAAHFRVFCEPDLHRILTRVLGVDEVGKALADVVPGLGTVEKKWDFSQLVPPDLMR